MSTNSKKKIIENLKKELQQHKDRNEMLVLERGGFLKKYHHPWVC